MREVLTSELMGWLQQKETEAQASSMNADHDWEMCRALQHRLQQDADRIAELLNDRDHYADHLRSAPLEGVS